MTAHLHPGERLHERLQMGFSVPDSELFYRAYRFKEWADNNPLKALVWLPKLRRTGELDCTAQLWDAVADIVEGRETPVPQSVAPPVPRTFTPAAVDEPVYTAPAKTPDPHLWKIENKALNDKYFPWRKTHITESVIKEVSRYAPLKVQEAFSFEARSDETQAPAVRRTLLKQAGSIWAALLNIKEPVLCQPI